MNWFWQILWQLPVGQMPSQHLSWVLSQRISLAVALDLAENGFQGAWRRSALYNILVFIFMEYINLVVQRRIQSLVKHLRWSFFAKIVPGPLFIDCFHKKISILDVWLSSECASGVFLNCFKLFSRS